MYTEQNTKKKNLSKYKLKIEIINIENLETERKKETTEIEINEFQRRKYFLDFILTNSENIKSITFTKIKNKKIKYDEKNIFFPSILPQNNNLKILLYEKEDDSLPSDSENNRILIATSEEINLDFQKINYYGNFEISLFEIKLEIKCSVKKIEDENNIIKHLILYEKIKLKNPKLEEVIKDNLINCFLISGLNEKKIEIKNSENFFSQCNHEECYKNKLSFNSNVIFYLNKKNSSIKINAQTSKLIFPKGIKICISEKGENLKSNIFSNVLTDEERNKFYIHSLMFYIKFKREEFSIFFSDLNDYFKNINNQFFYVPFSFSLITKIDSIFHCEKILYELYYCFKINLDTDYLDNEIVHLIYEIPFPQNDSIMSFYLQNYRIEIKPKIYNYEIFRPLNLKDILFNNLPIELIIKIFSFILTEKQIIFISDSQKILFNTIESFLYLIFPLEWLNTYVPILPSDYINYIESPIPFIFGIERDIFNSNKDKILTDEINDKLILVDIDNKIILPEKFNNIIHKENNPIYNYILENYSNENQFNNENIRKLFLEVMGILIGNFESYTSLIGNNYIFNQETFIKSKKDNLKEFYSQFTDTLQFKQFIQSFNRKKEQGEITEFLKYLENSSEPNNDTLELEMTHFYLYPYFFEQDKFNYDNFSIKIKNYYKGIKKPKKINYILSADYYIKFKIIMQNYIPSYLKKYQFYSNNFLETDINSNITLLEDSLNITADLINHGSFGLKKNSNEFNEKNLTLSEEHNNNFHFNQFQISSKFNSLTNVPYRHHNSLINMVMLKKNPKEILKYQEQINELLRDYMGYILGNESKINIPLNKFSYIFSQKFVKKEFSIILFQEKFNSNIEHELINESFTDLFKVIFYCLINSKDDKNEYEIIRLITKSLFFYFCEVDSKKIYLSEEFQNKGIVFNYYTNVKFWEYFYNEEEIERPLISHIHQIKDYMSKLGIKEDFINYCSQKNFKNL